MNVPLARKGIRNSLAERGILWEGPVRMSFAGMTGDAETKYRMLAPSRRSRRHRRGSRLDQLHRPLPVRCYGH